MDKQRITLSLNQDMVSRGQVIIELLINIELYELPW